MMEVLKKHYWTEIGFVELEPNQKDLEVYLFSNSDFKITFFDNEEIDYLAISIESHYLGIVFVEDFEETWERICRKRLFSSLC
jgi:hypothetical protein